MNQHLDNQQYHGHQLQAEALLRDTIANVPLNDKYTGEIKRFKKRVQSHPMPAELLHITISSYFITKASVKMIYVQQEQVKACTEEYTIENSVCIK